MGKTTWFPMLTALVGASICVALFRFNALPHTYEEYLVTNILCLLWLPIVLIFVVGRKEPAQFGFCQGDPRTGYRIAGLLFLGLVPLMLIACRLPSFQSYYPIQKGAETSIAFFAYFELTYGMYLFCWEFFFRGFLLFGLQPLIGNWSVLLQAIAFGALHHGKPPMEELSSYIAGIILGVVALRAKSFVPCFVLHWAAALTFDVLVILAKRHMLF